MNRKICPEHPFGGAGHQTDGQASCWPSIQTCCNCNFRFKTDFYTRKAAGHLACLVTSKRRKAACRVPACVGSCVDLPDHGTAAFGAVSVTCVKRLGQEGIRGLGHSRQAQRGPEALGKPMQRGKPLGLRFENSWRWLGSPRVRGRAVASPRGRLEVQLDQGGGCSHDEGAIP